MSLRRPDAGQHAADAGRCWVDGEATSSVPASDRGLQYGDGVFETIACRAGVPRFLGLHLARLARGCERLGFHAPATALLEAEIRAAAGGGPDCIVKVVVTRGSSPLRGYAPPPDPRPRRIVQRYDDPGDAGAARDGIEAAWSDVLAVAVPQLAGLKHLNRLDSVLARAALHGGPAREALMRAPDGRVVGGSMSNLFVCRDRELRTPAVDRAGVAGVMRSVVLREAAGLGFAVRECDVHPVDIAVASELFVANARIGVWPIVALGAWRSAPGPVVRAFQARIDALDE